MRQRIERSATGAIAPLAALLAALAVNPARAGDVGLNPDPSAGVRASQCAAPGESCARIQGYIRAGSEFPDPNAQRPARFAPPPLLAGVGDIGRAAAEALNHGMVLLKVSGEDAAR